MGAVNNGASSQVEVATSFVETIQQASSVTLISAGANVRGAYIASGAIFDGTYVGAGDFTPVVSFPVNGLKVPAGVAVTVERVTASPGNRVRLKFGSDVIRETFKTVTGAADSVGGQLAYKLF